MTEEEQAKRAIVQALYWRAAQKYYMQRVAIRWGMTLLYFLCLELSQPVERARKP